MMRKLVVPFRMGIGAVGYEPVGAVPRGAVPIGAVPRVKGAVPGYVECALGDVTGAEINGRGVVNGSVPSAELVLYAAVSVVDIVSPGMTSVE
jgi:hypothetical protein